MITEGQADLVSPGKNQDRFPKEVAVLLALFVAVVSAWFIGLRTDSPRINFILVGAVLPLPAVSRIILWKKFCPTGFSGRCFSLCLSLLSLITAFMFAAWLFMVTLWLPDVVLLNQDRSFERIRSVQAENGDLVRVYRTNGGAMTSFGVVIRKEIKFLPGIYCTTVIDSKYHQSDAEVSINPDGSVKINYDMKSPETTF